MKFAPGYKTYTTGGLMVLIAILSSFELLDEKIADSILEILGSAAVLFLRSAIAKGE